MRCGHQLTKIVGVLPNFVRLRHLDLIITVVRVVQTVQRFIVFDQPVAFTISRVSSFAIEQLAFAFVCLTEEQLPSPSRQGQREPLSIRQREQ